VCLCYKYYINRTNQIDTYFVQPKPDYTCVLKINNLLCQSCLCPNTISVGKVVTTTKLCCVFCVVCNRLVSCVSDVSSFSELSILDCLPCFFNRLFIMRNPKGNHEWNGHKQQLITTKVVSSNSAHGEVYSIQYYVIKFVSDLRHVSGFLRFSPPIN
jgi:hypothetical protein